MKKMKSLFIRNFNKQDVSITTEVQEGCEWVLEGEGIATRKYDGTCCLVIGNNIYKRFDYKKGRNLPEGAIPCQLEADSITGHFPHWVICSDTNPADKYHLIAFNAQKDNLYDGTYELCGEHFQSNIDKIVEKGDILIKHGIDILENVPRTFEGIKEYLKTHEIEGIVFHRQNGDLCKIKRSDFGFFWGNRK